MPLYSNLRMSYLRFHYCLLPRGLEGGGRGDRDGEDMWTQGLFISMYDKIHYKLKKKKKEKKKLNKVICLIIKYNRKILK